MAASYMHEVIDSRAVEKIQVALVRHSIVHCMIKPLEIAPRCSSLCKTAGLNIKTSAEALLSSIDSTDCILGWLVTETPCQSLSLSDK